MKTIFIFHHKKRGFIFLPILFFISFFMGMMLIEFQEIYSLFSVHILEKQSEEKKISQETLKNIVNYEKAKIEKYLSEYPNKKLYHYLTETEDQISLLVKTNSPISIGGYHLENEIPQKIIYDTWKGYFVKYYELIERKQRYKIRFMVEYRYGKNKKVSEFISYKIIEMEVYLL